MADTQSAEQEITNSPQGITQTYSDKADMRLKKNKGKWQTKEEMRTAEMVSKRFHSMQQHMRGSCPFVFPDATLDEDGDSSGGGMVSGKGSWFDYLDRCDKQWAMIKLVDGDSVDLRSPVAFAPIEAAMADFQKGDILALLEPTENESDTDKVRLINYAHDHLYYKKTSYIKRADNETFHDSLKYGWSWRYDGWFNKTQEVDIIQSSKQMLKDAGKDKKKIKDLEQKLEDGKPITKRETKVEHDDIGHVRVSPWEFYPDPDARYLRNLVYEMSDCIWRQTPTVEGCLAEFENSTDPFVVKENVEKVTSAKSAYDSYDKSDMPFFEPPEDIEQDTQVVLLRYYNKRTDKYIVLVNDIVIRDGPLPYNHKQLPFVLHKLINWENHLFGIGLCAVVEGLQSEDEELRSLMVEQLKINIAPPMIYNKKYGEDLDAWERYEAGQKIPIAGPVDSSIVQWMPTTSPRFDYFQMQGDIRQQTTLVTGIDPLASSMPRPDEAVRTHMMSMESTQKIIAKHIDNWGEGRIDAVWMDIRLMQQFYPLSYVEELDNEGKKTIKYKIVKTRGTGIEVSPEGKVKTTDKKYSFFEMKDEYLELAGDVDIKLNLDQIQAPSQTMMMQSSRQLLEAFGKLVASPQAMDAPIIPALMRWVAETHKAPSSVLESLQDSSSPDDVELAQQQNELLAKGSYVTGKPGESNIHISEHIILQGDLMTEIRNLDDKVKQRAKNELPNTPEEMRKAADELEDESDYRTRLEDALKRLTDHIQEDRIPKYAAAQAMAARAAEVAQPPQTGMNMGAMGMMPTPPMGGMPPMGGSPAAPMGMPPGAPMPGGPMGAPIA
jgi:hypothetical protein